MVVKTILFDLDGVLVDAAELHYQALNRALGLFGFSISPQEHKQVYNGLPTLTKLKMLGVPEKLHNIIFTSKSKYASSMIEDLVHPEYAKLILMHELIKAHYNIGVVTNSHRTGALQLLDKSRLSPYIRFCVTPDMDAQMIPPKPNPHLYLEALRLANSPANDVLAVEDSMYGAESANKAGIKNIYVMPDIREINTTAFQELGIL
jgi:HAD superfamily hydrolase (TIGR01509 family)